MPKVAKKSFQCEICQQTLASEENLVRHKKNNSACQKIKKLSEERMQQLAQKIIDGEPVPAAKKGRPPYDESDSDDEAKAPKQEDEEDEFEIYSAFKSPKISGAIEDAKAELARSATLNLPGEDHLAVRAVFVDTMGVLATHAADMLRAKVQAVKRIFEQLANSVGKTPTATAIQELNGVSKAIDIWVKLTEAFRKAAAQERGKLALWGTPEELTFEMKMTPKDVANHENFIKQFERIYSGAAQQVNKPYWRLIQVPLSSYLTKPHPKGILPLMTGAEFVKGHVYFSWWVGLIEVLVNYKLHLTSFSNDSPLTFLPPEPTTKTEGSTSSATTTTVAGTMASKEKELQAVKADDTFEL